MKHLCCNTLGVQKQNYTAVIYPEICPLLNPKLTEEVFNMNITTLINQKDNHLSACYQKGGFLVKDEKSRHISEKHLSTNKPNISL